MRPTIFFLFMMLLVVSCKEKFNSLQDVMTAIAPKQQRSTIDPTVDNVIKGEKGTQVFIPANALRFKDGTAPTGKVNIELTEFFSISEFISNNLSTVSDSILLETNGMLYISATAGGKELVVDKDKSYTIAFPKTDTTKRMGLFYGQPTQTGTVNWTQDRGPVFTADFSGGFGFEGDVGFDSLLVDSTLYEYKTRNCGYVWLTVPPDSNVVDSFNNNFKLPIELHKELCSRSEHLNVGLYLNEEGKVYKTEFKEKISPALQNAITVFLKTLPSFNMKAIGYAIPDYKYEFLLCCHIEFNQEKYAERFKQKYTQYKDKAIEKMDKGELGLYVFSATKFGWINCDRFYDDEREKIDFIVKVPSADSKTFIVFDSINSIMAGKLTDGNFVFPNVPLGSKVKVIAINFENGKPGMAVEQNMISKNAMNMSNFKSFTFSELEKQLNKS